MDSYSIQHFKQIIQFATKLKELPAQIEEHSYSNESFGSWVTIIRCKGIRMRLVFDGRDFNYSIQRSSSRKAPDVWEDTCWQRTCKSSEEFPMLDIVEAIIKHSTTG